MRTYDMLMRSELDHVERLCEEPEIGMEMCRSCGLFMMEPDTGIWECAYGAHSPLDPECTMPGLKDLDKQWREMVRDFWAELDSWIQRVEEGD